MKTMFFKNFSNTLINNNFYKISGDIAPLFIKEKNSVCYIVTHILYTDILKNNSILPIIERVVNSYIKRSGNRFSKFIFLQMICFDGKNYFDKSLLDIPFYPDEKIVKVVWGIDLYNKKIVTMSNQPTKLIDINLYIKNSLYSNTNIYINAPTNYIINKYPTYTYFFIILLSLIYSITMSMPKSSILKFTTSPNLFSNMEFYRLFTSMFLHSSFGHLLSNIFALYIFGARIERYIGKKTIIYTFIIGGIFSAICSSLFNNSYSLGASGAIFALEGALLYFSARQKIKFDGIDFYIILTLSVSSLLLCFLVPNIDNVGHISGFIIGIIMGIPIYTNYIKNQKISVSN